VSEMTLREGAVEVVRRLGEHGFTAYWVGGCVRDLEMGREPHDYDVATNARPSEVATLFPNAVLIGVKFGVVVVPLNGHHYEVSTFRTEGPYVDGRRPSRVEFVDAQSDVTRRDFTINGLLHDPLTGQTIDYVGGREDIARRIVRTIGQPRIRFAEDRLRMLRAVRLAAELQFDINDDTFRAIAEQADSITEVSAERIRDELLRLLTAPGRGRGVRLLHASGLLQVILPEVAAMAGVPQPPEFHPEGDVFTHTVLALEHLRDPSPVLAMATLLHDIGKPPTLSVSDRIRFNEHDVVGAEMAEAVCRRLRLSGQETERIVVLVRDHLRAKDLPKMRPAKAKRFLLDPACPDHLELHRADCLASHGKLDVYHWATAARQELAAQHVDRGRLISGDDLLALGYRPGPQYKTILDYVEDARLEGKARTREEALALIGRAFPLPESTRSPNP
jgi:putative nucleotidyltransferase with HDIG domain